MNADHPIVWDDAKVARLWNYYAKTPPYSDNYFSKVHGAQILSSCGLPLHEPLKILDFGCGPGFIWDYIKALGAAWTYVGVDFSRNSVDQLVRRAQGDAQFHSALSVSGFPTDLPAGEFDAVFLIEVLEHLNDDHLSATLNEVVRVVKTNGAVVVTTPNEEDLSLSAKYCPECGAIFHEWQHVRSWSRESLSRCMSSFGLWEGSWDAIDFAEKRSVARWLINRVRRLTRRKRGKRHMLARFVKLP